MVDYSNEGFIIPIVKDDVKGYASINSALYMDDGGLENTGHYHVYFLDPTRGSASFFLERSSENKTPWTASEGAVKVSNDVMQTIIEAIETREIMRRLGLEVASE